MKKADIYWELYRKAKFEGEVFLPEGFSDSLRQDYIKTIEKELQPLLVLRDALMGEKRAVADRERVVVDLGFANLVAYRGTDLDYKEVFIDLEDKDGKYLQDLAIIGGTYHYDEDGEVVQDRGISVRLWGDVDRCEITHEMEIGVRDLEKEKEAEEPVLSDRLAAAFELSSHGFSTREDQEFEY